MKSHTDNRSDLSVLLDLFPQIVLIAGLIVFYLAPYNLIRGDVDSVWEFGAALIGCGFWIWGAATIANAL